MKLTEYGVDYKDKRFVKEAACRYLADAGIAHTSQIMKVLERDRNAMRSLDKLVKEGHLEKIQMREWYYKQQKGGTVGRPPSIWRLTTQGVAHCQTTLGLSHAKECNKHGEAIKSELAKEDVRLGLRGLGFWPHRERHFRPGKQLVIPDNVVEAESKIVWVETESDFGSPYHRILKKLHNWCNFFLDVRSVAHDPRIRIIFLWQAPDQDFVTAEYQRVMSQWSRAVQVVCKELGLSMLPFELGFYAHSSFLVRPTIDWSVYQPLPDLQQLVNVSINVEIDEVPPPSAESVIARFSEFGKIFTPSQRKPREYVPFLRTWLSEEYALRIRLANAVTRTKPGSTRQLQEIAIALLGWMGYVCYPRPGLGDGSVSASTEAGKPSPDISIEFSSKQPDVRLREIIEVVHDKTGHQLNELVSAIVYLLWFYATEWGLQQGSSHGGIKLNLNAPPKTDPQPVDRKAFLDDDNPLNQVDLDDDNPLNQVDLNDGDSLYFDFFSESGTGANDSNG